MTKKSTIALDNSITGGFVSRLMALKGDRSETQFAKDCDIALATLRKYFDGSKPSIEQAAKISQSNGISLDWLITGVDKEPPDLKSVSIPKIHAKASAGRGLALVEDEGIYDHMTLSRDFLRQYVLNTDDVAAIEAQGDSMTKPDGSGIQDGDLLLVDKSVTEHFADKIYALDINGYLMVKRVKRLVTGGFEIISDNPEYGTEKVDEKQMSSLRILGHVFWHGHAI